MLESLLKKVACLQARKSIKTRLQHICFPVKIKKFLRTVFSIEQLWWLLLELRHFFNLWYITLKFMNIVWHKHNLMILIVNLGPNSLLFLVSCCWLWTKKCFLGPTLTIYKHWNNILLHLLTEEKKPWWNTHKKRSKVE